MHRLLLEIACSSVEGAVRSVAGGADRLELSAALPLGGLTPSVGLVAAVYDRTDVAAMALVRPRGGDAMYSAAEWDVMQRDAAALLEAGAAGIAFAAVDARGRVDARRAMQMVRLADGLETVFHRAFDAIADPCEALEMLIACGVTRVLTSGGAPTASEGADRLRALIERAGGRIEILPAGGIREHNVEELVRRTGCTQVHLSRR